MWPTRVKTTYVRNMFLLMVCSIFVRSFDIPRISRGQNNIFHALELAIARSITIQRGGGDSRYRAAIRIEVQKKYCFSAYLFIFHSCNCLLYTSDAADE